VVSIYIIKHFPTFCGSRALPLSLSPSLSLASLLAGTFEAQRATIQVLHFRKERDNNCTILYGYYYQQVTDLDFKIYRRGSEVVRVYYRGRVQQASNLWAKKNDHLKGVAVF